MSQFVREELTVDGVKTVVYGDAQLAKAIDAAESEP